jgi:hypothetical protein
MAKGRYQFAVIGADTAAAHLRLMEKNILSFNRAFETIGEEFREQVAEQFGFRGVLPGIRGVPWAPLHHRTIAIRKGGNRQLIRTGALASSYTIKGYPANISNTSTMTAKFGSGAKRRNNKGKIIPLAKFHQEGTSKMTARPVVLGNKQLDVAIVDTFAEHIFEGWV